MQRDWNMSSGMGKKSILPGLLPRLGFTAWQIWQRWQITKPRSNTSLSGTEKWYRLFTKDNNFGVPG
jgi:hypothetical protein